MLVFSISCEKDDNSFQLLEQEAAFNVEIIPKEQIEKNEFILKQLNKLKKVSNPGTSNLGTTARYSQENGFFVNTDEAKYMTSDEDPNFDSYTFLIFRDDPNNLIENLVFTKQDDGSYASTIVSYEQLPNDEVEIKYSDTDISSTDYLSRGSISFNCQTTVEIIRTYSQNCQCEFVEYRVISTDCTLTYLEAGDSTSGGDSDGFNNMTWTSDGTSSTGGGGGTGISGDGNPFDGAVVATSPFQTSQIKSLTEQTKNSKIKSRLQQMEVDVGAVSKEQGSEFRRTSNGYNEIVIPSSNTYFDGVKFPSPVANTEVQVHMHHDAEIIQPNGDIVALEPVFSLSDIYKFAKLYDDILDLNTVIQDNGNLSSILVSRRGLYALRITDASAALQFLNDISSSATNQDDFNYQEYLKNQYRDNVVIKAQQYCQSQSCTEEEFNAILELYFTRFYRTLNSGISLYQALDKDSNGDYIWRFLTN